MVELSNADNYDDAKHEWIATGEVWWDQVGDIEDAPEAARVIVPVFC